MHRFLALFLLFPLVVSAQTGLIFHKSHSGSASTFSASRSGNFGDPPDMQKPMFNVTTPLPKQEVIRLNDSIAVVKTEGFPQVDTLTKHPNIHNKSISLDSLKKLYPNITFTNFEEKQVDEVPGKATEEPSSKANGIKKSEKERRKKERKSDLWMLWVIGGGTFLGIGLSGTRKRSKVPTVHA